ncbi:uncharacterized protein BJ212DRAFT_1296918 [Suillus subaureus]|uniref:DUF6532 domain-containing protein n=1 Tax=Suillus subaureus TaxID=48587 RepID=A0A9P7EGM9_9AGAM|nr:uncharacterized protein BJ212DRAFT_1296918 [Suillus subaureus]KAG1821539.1 hypothetical protein BJ212DRAFT_1296918 [Suillus subaureus]
MPSTSNMGSSSGSRSTTSTSSLQNKHSISESSPPTSEAPDSSPILKFSIRAGNSPVMVTPNKPRVLPSVASPPLTSVVPTSSPILRGSSPILKSSSPIPKDNSLIPTQKSSSPILKNNLPVKSGSPVSRGSSLTTDALLTTGNQHGSLKRTHQYTLLEDDGLEDGEGFPIKKSKTLLTTIPEPDTASMMPGGTIMKFDLLLYFSGVASTGERNLSLLHTSTSLMPLSRSQSGRGRTGSHGSASRVQPIGDESGALQPSQHEDLSHWLQPYLISSHTPSYQSSSRASVSTMSLDDDDGLQHARRLPRHTNSANAKAIGFYDVQDKANIYQARKLLVINMILKTGWAQNREKLETEGITQECISQACAATKHVTVPTDGVMSLVFDELANIQGKLVLAAEGCLPDLGIDPKEMTNKALQHCVTIILDETNLHEYFLNGWDLVWGKVLVFSSPAFFQLHHEFWFGCNSPFLDPKWEALVLPLSWHMYGLMGAALLCVIRCATESRLSGVKNVLQFTTEEFCPFALEVQKAMKNYETHPELDDGEFMPHMNAHHDECL